MGCNKRNSERKVHSDIRLSRDKKILKQPNFPPKRTRKGTRPKSAEGKIRENKMR